MDIKKGKFWILFNEKSRMFWNINVDILPYSMVYLIVRVRTDINRFFIRDALLKQW